ncbi:hypothetical protein I4641_19375 [Waterburya agarophytonicola K14]|uniref:Uncharacterized protein n=1 Tax=Waterburya agarophytonicola KI4 TaxID=2874699 RepID=A0A964BWQ4_9CYAN|nr:hypothetical protein [Waterburya agarophytonicola]MCC0179132.1 hypothetical protein [Waterburya agarophytonicola KI4]
MFRVITPGFNQQYERWTDALNQANSLIPNCKGLFKDIRIYYGENLIWLYSRSHKYPQYIGAGVYDKLAKLFLVEAMEESGDRNEKKESNN